MMKPSTFLHAASSLLFSAAVLACSGAVVPLGEVDQNVQGTPGGETGLGAPAPGGGWAVPACAEPTGAVHAYTSIADTEARIEGAWFLCSGGIHSPADAAGIVLSPGKAHFLVRHGETLARGATSEHERDVSIIDATNMNGPGSYQIDFDSALGTNMYFSRTSVDGRFLELNEGTSGNQARYVRAEPIAATCEAALEPSHAYTSIADVAARIEGRWRTCAGDITAPADVRGLELAGSLAYFLVDADGALARKPTWDYERAVEILDTTEMNGPGSYQINLSTGGGTNMYFSRISAAGDTLELSEGTSGKIAVYTREP
jgi:hypothetical protein